MFELKSHSCLWPLTTIDRLLLQFLQRLWRACQQRTETDQRTKNADTHLAVDGIMTSGLTTSRLSRECDFSNRLGPSTLCCLVPSLITSNCLASVSRSSKCRAKPIKSLKSFLAVVFVDRTSVSSVMSRKVLNFVFPPTKQKGGASMSVMRWGVRGSLGLNAGTPLETSSIVW